MGKRRGNGEGSIYQRDDGTWVATVDLGWVNGKRKRKAVYGKTRKEVADKLKALHRDIEAGINVAPERQTVKKFLETWLEQTIKPRLRAKTYRSYEQIVRVHLVPHLGHYQMTKLAPEHVQAMLNSLQGSSGTDAKLLSPRTIEYIRAILRQALNQALRWGSVPRNVAILVDGPRVEKFKITPLSIQQIQQFLSAAAGHRFEPLYRLTLSLGLRIGEVLGLGWEHIDFAQATIQISGALQELGGRSSLVETKTKSGVRTLAMSPALSLALHAHQQAQARERADVGDAWQEHDLVFPSSVGTPMSARNLQRHFKTVLAAAGLPATIRFHDLRHSCATLLIAQGVHQRVVMEILGHSQISLTMNTYAHVLPETQREAAVKLDVLLARPQKEGTPEG